MTIEKLLKEAHQIKPQKKTAHGQMMGGYWFKRNLSKKEIKLIFNTVYSNLLTKGKIK